jgi:DNA-binding MarR family transcriptional regulator
MPEELDLVDGLAQLSFAVHEVLGRIAATHELSMTQLRLLGILRDRRPGTLELAARLNLEKSSVSGLIDRAERRGLVERTTAPHDGRAVQIGLTAQGRRLARRITAEANREITALAAPLPTADRDQLAALTSRIVAAREPAT